jgi:hypothetical protein
MTKLEEEMIEQLTDESELTLKTDYGKKDLKERRAQAKQMLYDGSKKLKHQVPKGKRT